MNRSAIGPFLVWSAFAAFLLPLAFFAETFLLLAERVKGEPIRFIPIYWILICGVPMFICTLIAFRLHSILGNIFLAGSITFSLVFLKLEYLELYFSLSAAVRLVCQLLIFSLLLIFFLRWNGTRKYPSLILTLAVGLLFVAAPYSAIKFGHERETKDNLEELTERIPELKDIRFNKRPNFYVLLYDALLPGPVADVFFGQGSATYHPFLQKHFYIPEGVTLQDDAPTKPSIYRFLWLDMAEATLEDDYFRGRKLSPLISIFRSNGYHITTGFHGREWRGVLGPYVDNYLTQIRAPLSGSSLCRDQGDGLRNRLVGFGVCTVLGAYREMPSFAEVFGESWDSDKPDAGPDRNALAQMWYSAVEDHIRESAEASGPHFSVIYTFKPVGHAAPRHDQNNPRHWQKYRDRFKLRSAFAVEIFEEVLEIISEFDPGAILIIAGDHGTMMARQSEDKGFRLVDRHSVAIGVWKSENVCAKEIGTDGFTPNKSGYHTIPTVVLSLVECLSDNPTILDTLPIVPAFSSDEVGDSWEIFMSRNLSDSLLETFKDP